MDNYGFKPEPKVKRKSPIWNILTALMMLGICCLGIYFVSVFLNPNSKLNPFPPALTPTTYSTETPTITLIQLEPTWTHTPTIKPSPTRTKAPTWTQLPGMITPTITETPTLTPIPGTETITPTPAPVSVKINYAASTTIYPDSACDWLGVGGTVVDANNKPLLFQGVQIGGTLDGKSVSRYYLSGSAPAYGTSGFEFILGDHPIASTKTLWLQLFDNAGNLLTDKIYFDTSANCTQNLVMVTFTKNH